MDRAACSAAVALSNRGDDGSLNLMFDVEPLHPMCVVGIWWDQAPEL